MIVKDFLGNEYSVECMGCAIGSGTMIPPGGVIKETGSFLLHQDPEIPVPGFIVITAKEHVQSILHYNQTARYELIDLIHEAVSAVRELKITERITVIQEERSKHFHVWLFPYYPWMDEYFSSPVSEYREVMNRLKADENQSDRYIQRILDTVKVIKLAMPGN
ncbi:MAG: hypothetical protein JW712_04245 [Dehalococcoidales bacterium]|nr:hypothetical protein [Dehalococcoidales bacterium]